jgi:hypothetical protein
MKETGLEKLRVSPAMEKHGVQEDRIRSRANDSHGFLLFIFMDYGLQVCFQMIADYSLYRLFGKR